MEVPLEDMAEMSRNLKVKSIGRIFFMKECIPDVKILTPEKIVEYTKTRQIDKLDWDLFLNYHPNGNINVFDDDVQALRSAQILSGKRDGYGLHLGIMGRAGTKKSMGWLETLDYKFSEISTIIGGGNCRKSALVPSFKERPADEGYFARVERVGFVDELGKMADLDLSKHERVTLNLFGEWTDILDCKERTVGSGNSNTCTIAPKGKHIFPTNPMSGRTTIHAHMGLLDTPAMSRLLWWVQDEVESEFLRSAESVIRISPHTSIRPPKIPESSPYTYTSILEKIDIIENRKKDIDSETEIEYIENKKSLPSDIAAGDNLKIREKYLESDDIMNSQLPSEHFLIFKYDKDKLTQLEIKRAILLLESEIDLRKSNNLNINISFKKRNKLIVKPNN
jgi:hypothetical protein